MRLARLLGTDTDKIYAEARLYWMMRMNIAKWQGL